MSNIMTQTGVIEGTYGVALTSDGAPSNGTSAVHTITIGGTPTAGSFTVNSNGGVIGSTITWTATDATLVSRVQTCLDGLFGSGNTLAAIGTLSSGIGTITVTYQGDLASLAVPLPTVTSALTGTSPTLAIASTTAGVTATHRGALPGVECEDTTNGNVYVNQGTAVAPVWSLVTTA